MRRRTNSQQDTGLVKIGRGVVDVSYKALKRK